MKIAACFRADGQECASVVSRMVRVQTHFPEQQHRTFDVQGGSIACITAGERSSAVPLLRTGERGNLLVITGVPISHGRPVEEVLAPLVNQDYQQAIKAISGLEGNSAAVFWDQAHKKLAVVSDFQGMQPLYIHHRPGLLMLASELKAIGASGLVEVKLDPAGWGQFISLGYLLGDYTALAEVRRAPAASVMVYDPADDTIETSTYWHWPTGDLITKMDAVDTGEILEALRMDIRGYSEHHRGGAVLLSGGFDSRLILALLASEGLPVSALICRHEDERGDADGRLAVRIAETLGVKYNVVSPPLDFYSTDAYLDYTVMNDVATPSLFLFIAQVWPHVTPELQAVWDGLLLAVPALKYLRPFPSGFAEVRGRYEQPAKSPRWKAAQSIFAPDLFQNLHQGFLDSFDLEVQKYPDDRYGYGQFLVSGGMRSRIAPNPLKVYANRVLPFTPGASRAFRETTAKISLELKAKGHLYFEIYRRHFPKLMQVPICSGGLPLFNCNRLTDPETYRELVRRIVGQRISGRLRDRSLDSRGSGLLDRVVAAAGEDHPDLNGAFVRDVKHGKGASKQILQDARHLLFYWQVWRWVMEGKLTVQRDGLFF